MNHTDRKYRKLQASTISELLVLMIISGIILISVFNGFDSFQVIRSRITNGLNNRMAYIEGYYEMENIISLTDSIISHGEILELFRSGEKWIHIAVSDSLLLLYDEPSSYKDTLMKHVSGYSLYPNGERENLIDSLHIINNGQRFCFWILYNQNKQVEDEISKILNFNNDED